MPDRVAISLDSEAVSLVSDYPRSFPHLFSGTNPLLVRHQVLRNQPTPKVPCDQWPIRLLLLTDCSITEYLWTVKHTRTLCDTCLTRIERQWFRCVYCGRDLCEDCEAVDTHDDTHFFMVFKSTVRSIFVTHGVFFSLLCNVRSIRRDFGGHFSH
jgi:hypothetical protein